LAITYEGPSQVKRNKLSLFTRKYELFTMVESEDVQCMFGCFQTILNELRSLGITYNNYDHVDKILRSLSRKLRPHVVAWRTLYWNKNVKSSKEKLLCGEKFKGLKGWGEYVVKEKLKGLKRKLKDWSKNVSCVEKSHFFLEKELNDLDKKEKMVGLEVDEVEKKKDCASTTLRVYLP